MELHYFDLDNVFHERGFDAATLTAGVDDGSGTHSGTSKSPWHWNRSCKREVFSSTDLTFTLIDSVPAME